MQNALATGESIKRTKELQILRTVSIREHLSTSIPPAANRSQSIEDGEVQEQHKGQ